jgi:protein-tyrosine-phosphatase
MKLTAEQIQENWIKFIGYIDTYISEPRASKLKEFYEQYSDRIIIMPAAHKKEYHNAFPGGYVEHVNRVIEASLKINSVWTEFGAEQNYTIEELVFSAMNHDLGKMGDENHESYIPQTDQWRKDKLGEDYTFNNKLEFMSVPDRGLFLLNSHGVNYTKNEWLAIKLHDGLYDDSNKPYLMSWAPETKVRTALVHIVHQADLLAAKIEFEREWFPKFKGETKNVKNNFSLESNNFNKPNNKTAKTKVLGSIKSEGLKNLLNNI